MRDLYELIEGERLYAIETPDGPVKLVAGRLRRIHFYDTVSTRRKPGGGVELVLEDGFLVAGHCYGLVLLEGDS